MKLHSIQFKFLTTVISAMLAVTLIIGGLSIYEVDQFVQGQTADLVNATCLKESTEINSIFSDMQKSVDIIQTVVLDPLGSREDATDPEIQNEIIYQADQVFLDVVRHTENSLAYYFRLNPEISSSTAGFFYSKINGGTHFEKLEPTDISLYDRDDDEHVKWFWQPYDNGEPTWLMPYYNQNNDVLMISYVVPLYYEDLFIGVVGMDFDYTLLTDRVHEIKIYDHGFAHLEIDGTVIHQSYGMNHNHGEDDAEKEYLRASEELINGMTLVLSASYDDIWQIRYNIALPIVFISLILAALFSVIVIIMVKRIVDPLKELTEASKKIAEGDYAVDIVKCNTYEIKMLSAAFENMTVNMREHEKMQHILAYRDSMTGVRNTTSYKVWVNDFDKDIENNTVEDFGILVLDMNYLKEANDLYGHDVGNRLIITAAQIIAAVFKRSPVFRIGGDEFLVVLQHRDLEDADELIRTLDSECMNASVDTGNKVIPISIARGMARFNPDTDTAFVDVFNRADDAMYQNKRSIKTASTT